MTFWRRSNLKCVENPNDEISTKKEWYRHMTKMTDHVIPLPSSLERAAIKIKKAITKRNGPIQDWIDANIELAEALIEARHEFGDNDGAFGAWCKYNGFTKDVLGKSERVALIENGRKCSKNA
jgi:hypothetical protein